MYHAFLVDDEPLILKGIESIFNWQKYGFEVAGMAGHAEEALEMILQTKPDVLFTDIRMGSVSGLQLLSMLEKANFRSRVVIITGYADFTYAQEAIRQQVFDYCLKPISASTAENLLIRLKKALDQDNGICEDGEEAKINRKLVQIDNIRFRKLMRYLYQYYSENFTLSILAEKFGLNENYCCFLFKKYFDSNYSAFLTQVRIEKAEEQIRETDLPLKEIGASVGYSDYYYFIKVFKKITGKTPYQYQSSCILQKGKS